MREWQPMPAGVVEGECDVQGGAFAGRAVQLEVAAEGLGPVFEADQPGAVGEVRAAAAVVTDAQLQDAAIFGCVDLGGGGAGVLGGFGEGFGDGVVGGGLDWLGQSSLDLDVEAGGDGASAGEGFQCRGQAAVGQDDGVQAAGDLAQVVQDAVQPGGYVVQLLGYFAGPGLATRAARRSRARETRRCWAPSCRSRSMRRRVASAVATIRAREAVRAAWAAALAIAVAASSVNPASRVSVPAGSGPARDPTTMTPQRRPSTLTGTPTAAPMPYLRPASATG